MRVVRYSIAASTHVLLADIPPALEKARRFSILLEDAARIRVRSRGKARVISAPRDAATPRGGEPKRTFRETTRDASRISAPPRRGWLTVVFQRTAWSVSIYRALALPGGLGRQIDAIKSREVIAIRADGMLKIAEPGDCLSIDY